MIKIEEFEKALTQELKFFIEELKKVEASDRSFSEWYKDFGTWLEVDENQNEKGSMQL